MEIWKSVVGYEVLYEVSSLGRVRSIQRVVLYGSKKLTVKERFLSPIKSRGYLSVKLSLNGIKKSFQIHRLVAIAFIDNPENKPEVNHKDGVKTNNFKDNLEWNTSSENQLHSYSTGLHSQIGENHHKSKITKDDVVEIRILFGTGKYSKTELGRMFSVSHRNIGYIVNNKIWKHV